MFDGQSLNNAPFDAPYPSQLGALLGPEYPVIICGRGGTTYAQRTTTAPGRVDYHFANATTNVLVDLGGQSDLLAGLTGSQLLAAAEAYADARRAAGADLIVALTCPHSTSYTAGQNTQRATYNAGLLTSAHFDAVVDIAADPAMADASDLTYWNADGLHPVAAGAAVIAGLVEPVLAALL